MRTNSSQFHWDLPHPPWIRGSPSSLLRAIRPGSRFSLPRPTHNRRRHGVFVAESSHLSSLPMHANSPSAELLPLACPRVAVLGEMGGAKHSPVGLGKDLGRVPCNTELASSLPFPPVEASWSFSSGPELTSSPVGGMLAASTKDGSRLASPRASFDSPSLGGVGRGPTN
jgi:hypothetical protein